MPLRFASVSRLDGEDVLMMGDALMLLVEVCARTWPPPARMLVSSAQQALADAVTELEGPVSGDDARERVVVASTERLLDAAACLLDAAQLLHRQGAPLAALAVEGVQGRLLEAVIGAGRLEPSA